MKIGFTGTRLGLTPQQEERIAFWFHYWRPAAFHHGDCVGADADAHELIRRCVPPCRVVIHPPDSDRLRAFCEGDEVKPPRSYLDRNHAIVDATSVLLACPSEKEEQVRSGTWATIRYARKNKKPLLIIFPDGTNSK